MKEDTTPIREEAAQAEQVQQLTGQWQWPELAVLCRIQEHLKMSLSTQEDTRSKFWRMPELVEFLDEVSVLSIVEVKLLTDEVFQTASKGISRCQLIRKVLGFEPPQTFDQQCIRKIEFEFRFARRLDLDLLLPLVSRVTRQLVAVETLGWYGPVECQQQGSCCCLKCSATKV